MKYSGKKSALITSEETVTVLEPVKPASNIFFCDTELNLDSSPESAEMNKFFSIPPVSEKNSKFIETGTTFRNIKEIL